MLGNSNLCMSFCSITGLINSVKRSSALESEPGVRLVALFDHEEIGSEFGYRPPSSLDDLSAERRGR